MKQFLRRHALILQTSFQKTAKNLERIKTQVGTKHFQIFHLYVLKNVPLRKVTETLHVSATLVYVTKHRLSALVKREVRRLEKELGREP